MGSSPALTVPMKSSAGVLLFIVAGLVLSAISITFYLVRMRGH